jgi:hypothetical protein
MCTVLLRFDPGAPWPLLLAAVRDEFAARAWDPPARHWDGPAARLIGGRDRTAGGTWLALDPDAPAVAAILNGVRRPPPADGPRPSRGALPLRVLNDDLDLDWSGYDGLHLIRATPSAVDVWSWDGATLTTTSLDPGDHIIVNEGITGGAADDSDPLVPHFRPLLAAARSPDPVPGLTTAEAWGDWLEVLGGDGLAPTDPRALLVRVEFEGRVYGSTSASLVALGPTAVRYDFCPDPLGRTGWREIAT